MTAFIQEGIEEVDGGREGEGEEGGGDACVCGSCWAFVVRVRERLRRRVKKRKIFKIMTQEK